MRASTRSVVAKVIRGCEKIAEADQARYRDIRLSRARDAVDGPHGLHGQSNARAITVAVADEGYNLTQLRILD